MVAERASTEYLDPSQFFADTYPTRGLKNLLHNVCQRLAGTGGEVAATGPAIPPESPASTAWEAAYVEEHGAPPVRAYVKETYDATVALALAAEATGSLDGAAVRDRLRAVGGGPGVAVNTGPEGIADALRILAEGGAIDYEGASGTMDWDANGDLSRGHVGIWRFTGDERIEEVGAVPFER